MAVVEEVRIFILAYQLARSGAFRNAKEIIAELRLRGIDNIQPIAKDVWVRTRLTSLCFQARKYKTNA